MKKFILGFVMAIISIVVGVLIFVGKIVHRGSKNMPLTTKRYIKDQFTFVDISKLKNAIANSIKAFVDWVLFAKETTCFEQRDGDGDGDVFYYDNKPVYKVYKSFNRSYHAQKHNDICKVIDKCMAKSDKPDDAHYFIEAEEFGGDGIYTKENYIYVWDTKNLKWLDSSRACDIVGPDWLIKMIEGYVSGYSVAAGKIDTEAKTVYIRDQEEDRDYCIHIKFSSENDSDDVKGD